MDPLVLVGEWPNLPSTNEAFTHSLEVRNAMDIAHSGCGFCSPMGSFFSALDLHIEASSLKTEF